MRIKRPFTDFDDSTTYRMTIKRPLIADQAASTLSHNAYSYGLHSYGLYTCGLYSYSLQSPRRTALSVSENRISESRCLKLSRACVYRHVYRHAYRHVYRHVLEVVVRLYI